jgi:hypothetical protein
MRVFIIGAGRSGSMTFSKACKHINNFTSAHETSAARGAVGASYLNYPDNHIEIDSHLNWFPHVLDQRYPGAMFFHLKRDRESVVKSWIKRSQSAGTGVRPLMWPMLGRKNSTPVSLRADAELIYDELVLRVDSFITRLHGHKRTLHIESMEEEWPRFLAAIEATTDDYDASVNEFKRRYNAST